MHRQGRSVISFGCVLCASWSIQFSVSGVCCAQTKQDGEGDGDGGRWLGKIFREHATMILITAIICGLSCLLLLCLDGMTLVPSSCGSCLKGNMISSPESAMCKDGFE